MASDALALQFSRRYDRRRAGGEGDAWRLEVREVHPRKLAKFFELVHSNGFNSPSMVGINSVTVG